MHAEIFPTSGGGYCWRKRNKGRTTTCAEVFPRRTNAIRAAMADVRQTIKPMLARDAGYLCDPKFTRTEKDGVTILRWS